MTFEIDFSREERRLEKEPRAMDARPAGLKIKHANDATHGRRLQELRIEMADQMLTADKHGGEAQEKGSLLRGGLSMREEKVLKQRTELEGRPKESTLVRLR